MGLGTNIKVIRLLKGIPHKEMAERLNISDTFYSGIEAEKKAPSPRIMKELSEILDVPEKTLLSKLKIMEA